MGYVNGEYSNMTTPIEKPFGFWDSPITAKVAAGSANRYSQIKTHRNKVYWLEGRPNEKGRSVIVCYDDQQAMDVTPVDVSVQTKVHEYGGGDYCVGDLGVYFVNKQDQCIYRINDNKLEQITQPVTIETRYADLCLTPDEQYLICVREQHAQEGVINDLVCLPLFPSSLRGGKAFSSPSLRGKCAALDAAIHPLTSGADFYMFPCLSPNGKNIAWIQWHLPQMPWDGTELWCADFVEGKVENPRKIAGSKTESIYQPSFSPNNELIYVSDRSGFWNIYQNDKNIGPMQADCGYPAWIFGTSTYAFIDESKIAVIVTENAMQKMGVIEEGKFKPVMMPYDSIEPFIATMGDKLFFIGGNARESLEIRWIAASSASHSPRNDGEVSSLRPRANSEAGSNPFKNYLSMPKAIEFKTANDYTAYAFYYPPKNPDFVAPHSANLVRAGDKIKKELPREAQNSCTKPPLLVMSHGGPTASTSTALDYKVQFWTSRGFAVIDVNYRGSTGYGRAYRDLLYRSWGKVDVEDCIHAAQYCIDNYLCNSNAVFIRGKSASGLTTLLCLEESDLFTAGGVYYGVTDLTVMLDDTHKFESHYAINLVGYYPEAKMIYEARSALKNVDKLNSPVIVFQGLQDKVVPPPQSEAIVTALKKKNIPVEYITFKDEAHGFRNAENVENALKSELAFYLKMM